jgi:hypothetical protein
MASLTNTIPTSKEVLMEKLAERESWHKLVVKVLTWQGEQEIRSKNKLTLVEWTTYHERMVKTNVTGKSEKVLSDLKATQDKIRQNGGFE